MNKLLLFLERIVTHTSLYRFNKFMYLLSTKGMGIDNQGALVKKGEQKVLRKLVPASGAGVVFDVGANLGHYVEDVLALNSTIELYAFEPHPKTFQKLAEKAKQLHFTAINSGCADVEGTLKFYDYADNDGSEHASLLKGVFTDIYHHKTVEYEVHVTTLDAVIKARGIKRIDLLKIDTEGYDYNVLKGATESIRENKIAAIHMEFNRMNIISKVFMQDIMNLLPQYQLYRVMPNGLLKIEQEKIILTEIFGFQNIVAINTTLK